MEALGMKKVDTEIRAYSGGVSPKMRLLEEKLGFE